MLPVETLQKAKKQASEQNAKASRRDIFETFQGLCVFSPQCVPLSHLYFMWNL